MALLLAYGLYDVRIGGPTISSILPDRDGKRTSMYNTGSS